MANYHGKLLRISYIMYNKIDRSDTMSKRVKIVFIILGVIILSIICLKSIPYGTTTYKMPNSGIYLKAPKFSMFKEECCMFSSSFQSLRSKFLLEVELERMMNDYEKIVCHNQDVYYDKNTNITITDYGVKSGLLFNEFYITYDKGYPTNNECSVVTDATKMTYQIDYSSKNKHGICYHPDTFQYVNEDGNSYNVHYTCFGDILFQSGMNKMHPLNNLLSMGWVSMSQVIDFLEYQVIEGTIKKETYQNEDTVMYRGKDFSLLKCGKRSGGNKDIYIGDPKLKYDKKTQCANFGTIVQ